jgi:hypothetical protein
MSACAPKSQEADVSAAQKSHAATAPSPRFTGTLRGGIVAVGAETTGWVLERNGDSSRVDVEVSHVSGDVSRFDGKRVVIHGTMTTATWLERGERPLLIAERIEPE